jgi:NAD-dependent deacetylase
MSMKHASARELKKMIQASAKIVVFTGAGISTPSGISDYRSQGGIWNRYQPITYQEFIQDRDKRIEYWKRKKEMYLQIRDAKPNAGHLAITELEKRGKLLGVITQNIDGLHLRAGNSKVLELHGTNVEVICLDCEKITSFDPVYERLVSGEEVPLCTCGGLLKPNTISFGQTLNPTVLNQAYEWVETCDMLLAVGSTLIVEPAASLPSMAKHSGASLAIVNREPTPLDDFADLVIHGDASVVLKEAIE